MNFIFYIFMGIGIAFFGGILVYYGFKRENYIWNNGICRESDKPWKFYTEDSQGGRGYTDGEGHYCWISYDIDEVKV